MYDSEFDIAVIGAGVVGLAIARSLSERGFTVIIIESASEIGSNTSRRNSGVIHSGIYYPSGSLRARLCVQGRHKLYKYCQERGLPHRRIGKLIVAKDSEQIKKLEYYMKNGKGNGVTDLQWLDKAAAQRMEPEVKCEAAIFSPSTGIVDLNSLMQAYMKDAHRHGVELLLDAEVIAGNLKGPSKELQVRLQKTGKLKTVRAKTVINSAGLNAQDVSCRLKVPENSIPRKYYAKGNYFALKGAPPFKHLIYPVPVQGGLGTHLTLDLKGGAKFGPDVEYIDDVNFSVSTHRLQNFEDAIREYWPKLPDNSLEPAFAGVRPKLHGPEGGQDDFVIDSTSVAGFVALYGIESPGLTSSLAIGEFVADSLHPRSRL